MFRVDLPLSEPSRKPETPILELRSEIVPSTLVDELFPTFLRAIFLAVSRSITRSAHWRRQGEHTAPASALFGPRNPPLHRSGELIGRSALSSDTLFKKPMIV